MMRCKETGNLLAAWLDGETTAKEKEDIEAHLAVCPACREELKMLSETQAKFKQTLKIATENVSPSGQAWAELRQQITQEQEKAVARILPPQESFWQRVKRTWLTPKRFTWKTATAGVLAVALIVSMAIAIPILTGHSEKLSAAEIALADPAVQAALGDNNTEEMGVTERATGISRVVIKLSEGFLIVDVDTKTHCVINVVEQTSSNISEQRALDIAQNDQRVQELLDSGMTMYFGSAFDLYPDTFPESELKKLGDLGITDTDSLIGFIATISISANQQDDPSYVVYINLSTEKVAGVVGWTPDGEIFSIVMSAKNGSTETVYIPASTKPKGHDD